MARKSASASMIGVGWEDLLSLNRKLDATATALSRAETGMYYWLGGDTGKGGALTRKAAYHLAESIKSDIRNGVWSGKFPALHKLWRYMKSLPLERWGGNPLHDQMGMATGSFVRAITTLDQGRGRFRVGVHQKQGYHTRPSIKIGSYDHIYTYARLLEFGHPQVGPRKPAQPGRPFIAMGFQKWASRDMPRLFAPYRKAMAATLNAIHNEWPEGQRYSEEDLMPNVSASGETTYTDVDPFDMDELEAERLAASRSTEVFVERSDDLPEELPEEQSTFGVVKDSIIPGVKASAEDLAKGLVEGQQKMISGKLAFWNEEDQRWQKMSDYTKRITGMNY